MIYVEDLMFTSKRIIPRTATVNNSWDISVSGNSTSSQWLLDSKPKPYQPGPRSGPGVLCVPVPVWLFVCSFVAPAVLQSSGSVGGMAPCVELRRDVRHNGPALS